jgi:hypothetical protein
MSGIAAIVEILDAGRVIDDLAFEVGDPRLDAAALGLRLPLHRRAVLCSVHLYVPKLCEGGVREISFFVAQHFRCLKLFHGLNPCLLV